MKRTEQVPDDAALELAAAYACVSVNRFREELEAEDGYKSQSRRSELHEAKNHLELCAPAIRRTERERIIETLEGDVRLRREAAAHYREQGAKEEANACATGASAVESALASLQEGGSSGGRG